MKVLLINGSPNEHGCTYTALKEVAGVLESEGISTESYWIGKGPVAGCKACMYCKRNAGCSVDDDVNAIGSRLDEFDAMVIGSPVYYAGPSGSLQSFLDRLFYAYGGRMANKLGAAVVSCRRGGATAAFDRLDKYFTISKMHIVSSQYWNQVHGNTPEEVLQDAEGLQTMRTLGANMAWLLKCIEAGDAAGVKRPEYESWQKTNFIR